MIQENIKKSYPHHLAKCTCTDQSLFIADYTDQTKEEAHKRGTEFFVGNPPTDIEYFSLHSPNKLRVLGIPFDKDSFRSVDDKIETQCECVILPQGSNSNSWICFIELKYSGKKRKNPRNLNKAKEQLIETQKHYRNKNIFSKTNPCYLLLSFPKQSEPFANIFLSQDELLGMKEKYNIIMRPTNSAEIIDSKQINA